MMAIPDDKQPLSPMPGFFAEGWRNDDVPADGAVVTACAEDYRCLYTIPFAVRFQDDEWLKDATGERLDCYVAGWKPRT